MRMKLLARVREFRWAVLLAPLFSILEVVMDVIVPLIVADLIDRGIDGGDIGLIGSLGLKLTLYTLLALAFGVLGGRLAATASTGLARNLRHDMYAAVQDFSFANIDRLSTGSIITRLTTDVNNVQNAFQMTIRVAVRAPAMLIFTLFMVFRIHRQMGLLFVGVMPIMLVGIGFLMRLVGKYFARVFRTYDEMNMVVQQNVRGIRVVKAYVREQTERQKFGAVAQKLYRGFSTAQKLMAGVMPLMQLVMYATMLLLSWLGARFIVAGDLTTGELTTLFAYAMQILMSLMMLSMIMVMLSMSSASADRIVELLEEKPSLREPENPKTEVADGSVCFEGVSFSYKGEGGRQALQSIDLTIKSGQTVGILGGTGSGKSTLVQLIPRLYDVTQGKVTVGGVDVREYGLATLREAVSVVLQKNTLFSGSVAENLRWGDENATEQQMWQALRISQAAEFVEKMPEGLGSHIEQGGSNVSGGQRQRLCIARALLKKPKILIFDDSTSAVDTKTDALIRDGLAEALPETTKLVIAQRVSSVQNADLILIMEGGQIVAQGTHDSLLAGCEIYQQLYAQQNKGGAA